MNSANAIRKKSAEIEDKLIKAAQLYNDKKHKSALKHINNILRINKSEGRALILKAYIYEQKGKLQKALYACADASTASPENHAYRVKESELLIELGRFTEAKDILEQLHKEHPNSVAILGPLITAYAALKFLPGQLYALLVLAGINNHLKEEHQVQLTFLCKQIEIRQFSNQIIKGFIAVLGFKELQSRDFADNIARYLTVKYNLTRSGNSINISEIIRDELLLKALPLVVFCNKEVEEFFTQLRASLTEMVIKNSGIPPKVFGIIHSLALNNYLNEYIGHISEREQVLLDYAVKSLSTDVVMDAWSPHHSESILLIISMYQHLFDLPRAKELLTHPNEQWPESLKVIAKKTLFDIKAEHEKAREIPSLQAITNDTSLAVQQQYEQNPYPRWINLGVGKAPNLASTIIQTCPNAADLLPSDLYDPKTNILIAGSGTGQQPLGAAKCFPEATVTAFDISRRSLAYAMIKAKELEIDNIEFLHADILEIPESVGKFYYAECCGVLHHMEDPLEGWRKLLKLLEPGGILTIALYSESARRDITVERNKIAALNIDPTPNNIRLYRKALFSQHPVTLLASMFSDFYSLSECRDLLFHRHEKCFTWETIKNYCSSLNVEFLGLAGNINITNSFLQQFPEEKDTTSFEMLEAYERKSPYAFATMYQFYVQKPFD